MITEDEAKRIILEEYPDAEIKITDVGQYWQLAPLYYDTIGKYKLVRPGIPTQRIHKETGERSQKLGFENEWSII